VGAPGCVPAGNGASDAADPAATFGAVDSFDVLGLEAVATNSGAASGAFGAGVPPHAAQANRKHEAAPAVRHWLRIDGMTDS
jgi:hypothetical protein